MMKVAAICETHAVGIIPHFTGPIATAALVNCLSTFSGPVLMEYNYGGRPIDYLPECLDFKNGKAYTNQRPGLGVTAGHEAADDDRRGHRAGTQEYLPAAGRIADALVSRSSGSERCDGAQQLARWREHMKRRDALRSLSMAGGASLLSPSSDPLAQALTPEIPSGFFIPASRRRSPARRPIKIRDIKTILTAPNSIRLVVVKVETTEPGLVGWGCATFTQRALVVQTAIEQYLKPFLIGRNVDEIEDIWQSSYVSSYWRNGPVLFNAMSGVDIALWDIKGKRAGMPLYQLLGGKVRHGADCYFHASGSSFAEVEDSARAGDGAGLPPRPRAGRDARVCRLRRARRPRRRGRRAERGDRPDQSARDLGAGAVRAHAAEVLRAPAHASSATRSSCCTTCTSASR